MNDETEFENLKTPLEDLKRECYENVAWYFSKKERPEGVYGSIGKVASQLETLNENLESSNKSSEKLSTALHWLTVWGVLVATTTLWFEIYKYCNQ